MIHASLILRAVIASGAVAMAAASIGHAQAKESMPVHSRTEGKRTRLILRDGSYQLVTSYREIKNVVHYTSAERGGQDEEIPSNLIDWDATAAWERQHDPTSQTKPQAPPVIDPELAKEEADLAARTPEVAANLHLPERESVLALDTFQGTPELVPLTQSDGDLNRQTAHNVLKAIVNPISSSHQLIQINGAQSGIQLHVDTPDLYIRIKDDPSQEAPSNAFNVDTHGAAAAAASRTPQGATTSRYVIVRADVRQDVRIVSSFNISMLGTNRRQEDVIETESTTLPGGYWMRLHPTQAMSFGEYALMEIISDKEVNLGVWDFGVHPRGPENRDAIKPEERRRPSLEKRR